METDGKKYESVLQKTGLIKQRNDIGDELQPGNSTS